jgi:uncharacterized protein with HEPN domain
MSKRGDTEFLNDIQEAISRIISYVENLSYDEFLRDIKTQDAVIRNLEIIGESAKNLSRDFRKNNPDIAWKDMGKVRDKLIHHYFGVNLDIVWTIVKDTLPVVTQQIEKIIE